MSARRNKLSGDSLEDEMFLYENDDIQNDDDDDFNDPEDLIFLFLYKNR